MKNINVWYESEEVPHFRDEYEPCALDSRQITITERQYKRLNRLTEDYWELVQEIKDAEDKQIDATIQTKVDEVCGLKKGRKK